MPKLGKTPSQQFDSPVELQPGVQGQKEIYFNEDLYAKAQHCIINGNIVTFTEVLDEIGDVNMSSAEEQNNTLLHWCVLYNNVHMARMLLERGARELGNSLGKTPLELAKDMCEAGDFSFIEVKNLLQDGVRRTRKHST